MHRRRLHWSHVLRLLERVVLIVALVLFVITLFGLGMVVLVKILNALVSP